VNHDACEIGGGLKALVEASGAGHNLLDGDGVDFGRITN
jgi:hypothetical protein